MMVSVCKRFECPFLVQEADGPNKCERYSSAGLCPAYKVKGTTHSESQVFMDESLLSPSTSILLRAAIAAAKVGSADHIYSYSIGTRPHGSEYICTCSEFPGLTWRSRTRHGATIGMERMLREVLTEMAANGEQPPEPKYKRADN